MFIVHLSRAAALLCCAWVAAPAWAAGLAWSAGDQPHLVHGGGGQDVCLPDCPPDPAQPTEPGALVRHWLRRGGSTA